MEKYRKFIGVVVIIQLLLLMYIYVYFKVDDINVSNGVIHELNDNWVVYRVDGTIESNVSLPYAKECEAYEKVKIENYLPASYEGLTMSFLTTDQIFEVFVDGKKIYEFGINDARKFGKTPGSGIHFVDLPRNMRPGKVEIVFYSPYSDFGADISEVTIGRRNTLTLGLLKERAPQLILNMILICCSVVLFFILIVKIWMKSHTEGLEYLSPLCFMLGVFYTIQTRVSVLFFGNQVVITTFTYYAMMTMPIFVQLYFQKKLPEKYENPAKILLSVSYLNVIVQNILQIFNIFDFREMHWVTNIIIWVTFMAAVIISAQVYYSMHSEYMVCTVLSIIALGFGVIGDVVISVNIKGMDAGKCGRIGAVIFALLMVYIHFTKVSKTYAKRAEEHAELLKQQVLQMEKQNKLLKLAKEEAENAKKEAIYANAAKSNFLANMSHEIRTPINAVLGMDEMILRESTENKVKEYAMDIKNAGQNLLTLINDILDFSKIESRKMEIIPVRYKLSSLLNDCYNLIYVRAKEKNLDYSIKVDPNIPDDLVGDEVRIRQILVNLLTNAVKYTTEGKITMYVNFRRENTDRMILSVSIKDTGQGILEENQKKLFESFQRIEEKRNRTIEGTGLGLAITKELVDLMNGVILVESKYGKGSIFTVEIPQIVRSDTAIGDFQLNYIQRGLDAQKAVEILNAPDAKVLVVDDVEMNLKVVKELLKITKIQVDTVTSGVECIEKIQKERYDMVFLDHMMPVMDGIETLQMMKKLHNNMNADVPVIMLTANAISGAKEEYLKEGFTDYLSKPIREIELENMLKKYLPDNLIEMVLVETDIAESFENETAEEILTKDTKAEKEDVNNEIGETKTAEKDNVQTIASRFPFLDTSLGIGYCANSETVYLRVLKLYVEGDLTGELNLYYDNKNIENYQIQAHSLKSTSLNIGATGLHQMAKDIEQAAKSQNWQYIEEHHGEMMQEYSKVLKLLETSLSR